MPPKASPIFRAKPPTDPDSPRGRELLNLPETLHPYLLLPLAAAILYAAAALCLKIALGRGVTTWSVLFYSNIVLGLFFAPLLLAGPSGWNAGAAVWALASGVLFFLGQVGTFRSLQSGDVSVATPALASKVVFVALLSLLVPGNRPDPDLWLAVVLTMAGMILLHRGPKISTSRPLITLAWALFAALSFAAADIVVQVGAPVAGFTLFMPVMFGTVALLSLPLLWPHILRPPQRTVAPGARRWLAVGVFLLGLQATGMASAIGLFGDATAANVIYGSRGLWSLLLLAVVARRLGITDSVFDRRTLGLRVVGCVLILGAVTLVLF
jgi:drug/metabolite transporter (DMT)-like permease